MKTLFVSVLLFLSLALTIEAQTPKQTSPTIARDLEFRALDGKAPIRMSDYEEQTVVLVIWASWCPPCRLALAEITKLKRESFAKSPFPILALSTEDPTKAEAELRRQIEVINYSEQNGWIDENSPLLKGQNVLPQILIVKNLKVTKQFVGWNSKYYTQFQTALRAAQKSKA